MLGDEERNSADKKVVYYDLNFISQFPQHWILILEIQSLGET